MKTLQRVIQAQRTSDGAGVTLHRSLGQSQFARLDPFLMLDEFGSDRPDEYIAGFPAHPHRGFQTVTYMLEGHMLHEDHLGNKGHLRSGDVQWMNAGRGIIHSEMPQQEQGLMRGFQLWVNLPAREKMGLARYQDTPASAIPSYTGADGVVVKAVAGVFERDGERIEGPVRSVSTTPLFFDVHLPADGRLQQAVPAAHNSFVYVYEGSLVAASGTSLTQGLAAKQGGVFAPGGEALVLQAGPAGGRCLLLSATPIGEPIAQYGPFVMNTREEIEQAVRDYQSGRLTA